MTGQMFGSFVVERRDRGVILLMKLLLQFYLMSLN